MRWKPRNSDTESHSSTNVASLRYSTLFPFSPLPSREVLTRTFLHEAPAESPPKSSPRARHTIYGRSGQERLLYTALHQSILDGRLHQTELLVRKCGADVNSQDVFGRTPSMLCCTLEDEALAVRLMRVLLQPPSSSPPLRLEIRDNLGRTALAHACIHGRVELCDLFLRNDCDDFGEADNDGETPLHHAARQGNAINVENLCHAYHRLNVDIDKRNHLGYTALLLALKALHLSAAVVLLSVGGAAPGVRDNEFFLNAKEWYDKMTVKERRRREALHRMSLIQGGGHVPLQTRPAFLTERSHTFASSFNSTFYKELINPTLRDSMLHPDLVAFSGTSGMPQLPPSSREMTQVHLQTPIILTPQEVDSENPLASDTARTSIGGATTALTASKLQAMSESEVGRVLKKLLCPPPDPTATTASGTMEQYSQQTTSQQSSNSRSTTTKHSRTKVTEQQQQQQAAAALNRSKTAPTINYRPDTAKLMPYRVRTSCSSLETVRRLLLLYSDAAIAPPPAHVDRPKRVDLSHRKVSMMRSLRVPLVITPTGGDSNKMKSPSPPGPNGNLTIDDKRLHVARNT